MTTKYIIIKQIKSCIGKLPNHRSTILSLGLKHINDTSKLKFNSKINGMIKLVNYMIKIL